MIIRWFFPQLAQPDIDGTIMTICLSTTLSAGYQIISIQHGSTDVKEPDRVRRWTSVFMALFLTGNTCIARVLMSANKWFFRRLSDLAYFVQN